MNRNSVITSEISLGCSRTESFCRAMPNRRPPVGYQPGGHQQQPIQPQYPLHNSIASFMTAQMPLAPARPSPIAAVHPAPGVSSPVRVPPHPQQQYPPQPRLMPRTVNAYAPPGPALLPAPIVPAFAPAFVPPAPVAPAFVAPAPVAPAPVVPAPVAPPAPAPMPKTERVCTAPGPQADPPDRLPHGSAAAATAAGGAGGSRGQGPDRSCRAPAQSPPGPRRRRRHRADAVF
mmetsp:Transcript_36552/g.71894  ORF Transcript_36552/g.71894 Transcript_36552/m.71894 type:complete len:232 (-) Transcript_36552:194-889(-)